MLSHVMIPAESWSGIKKTPSGLLYLCDPPHTATLSVGLVLLELIVLWPYTDFSIPFLSLSLI